METPLENELITQKLPSELPPTPKEVFPDFNTPKIPESCTYNQCSNGHKFAAQLAVTECPGCKGKVLVVLMENCPVCNEPTERFRMRTDHVGRGGGIAAQCLGQKNHAEVTEIVMKREHAAEVEKNRLPAEADHARATQLPEKVSCK